ncbi:MAG: F0F1 ATP synthase subunit A [Rickettsiales bacterium]|jgi:F-type H+-transporting ATPase subunit a|nr:F0F1 ATP synthase subunit A [Rickettsiales bacterium]
MRITPDEIVFFRIPVAGWFHVDISMTLVSTWIVMAILFVACRTITRNFSADFRMTRMQNAAEVVVKFLRSQVEGMMGRRADAFIVLIGSLFVFILASNWSALLPIPFMADGELEWYMPPTASLSTALALALVVMCSVVLYGIESQGAAKYFRKFLRPAFVMLPMNLLSEVSHGVSLALRLYGNIMSGTLVVAILFAIAPLFVPGLMNVYGLLAGTIQPYIFSMLALVYVSAAVGDPTVRERTELERIRLYRI